MSQAPPDEIESSAVQAMRDALAVVRRYRLAEVEIVVSSDRVGAVHLRQQVRVPLPALVGSAEEPPLTGCAKLLT